MTQPIDFSDYHRTVIGFHGTTVAVANRLVAGEPFKPSDQNHDWFGEGIYFWEHAFQQAWKWAKRVSDDQGQEPAVIGAVIRLGRCFDLLDPGNVAVLSGVHEQLVEYLEGIKVRPPVNVQQNRRLDCAVFNHFYEMCRTAGRPLDTTRAVYVPTSKVKRAYKGSWISEDAHIQVCVQNPKNILAVWHVREDGSYGK